MWEGEKHTIKAMLCLEGSFVWGASKGGTSENNDCQTKSTEAFIPKACMHRVEVDVHYLFFSAWKLFRIEAPKCHQQVYQIATVVSDLVFCGQVEK